MPSWKNTFKKIKPHDPETSRSGKSQTSTDHFTAESSHGQGSIKDNTRFKPCDLLRRERVPNVIWLEDLLVRHGSNTVAIDLHLLVEDVHQAADVLQKFRYGRIIPDSDNPSDLSSTVQNVRLTGPSDEYYVVLLPASHWYYDINQQVDAFTPPLNRFLDSMMEFWLSISSQDYEERLPFALYIACIIKYCYELTAPTGDPVKDPAYARNLKNTHHELHYDIVLNDPAKPSFTTTARHRYHVMKSREIANGTFRPKPYKKGEYRPNLSSLAE